MDPVTESPNALSEAPIASVPETDIFEQEAAAARAQRERNAYSMERSAEAHERIAEALELIAKCYHYALTNSGHKIPG